MTCQADSTNSSFAQATILAGVGNRAMNARNQLLRELPAKRASPEEIVRDEAMP